MKNYGFTLAEVFSPSRKAKRSFGFTLAEVLITVGIIGVVSALTVPTLVKNHQRQVYVTQLRKVYNEISNAVEQYMSDQRVEDLRESDIGTKTQQAAIDFVNSSFKIVKNCHTRYNDGGSNNCFGATYESLDGSVTTDSKTGQCQVTFTIPSGAAVCVDIGPMEDVKLDDDTNITSSNFAGTSSDNVIMFEVDVNGSQGPNIFGRDMFYIQVASDGTLNCDRNPNTNDAAKGFCHILDNNWQMNY